MVVTSTSPENANYIPYYYRTIRENPHRRQNANFLWRGKVLVDDCVPWEARFMV